MVGPLLSGGRARLAEALARLFNVPGRGARPRLGVTMSQRELQRLTGLPRQTVQDFLRDPSRSRPGTVARIQQVLESPVLQSDRLGVNTRRIDAPLFDEAVFDNLVRPPGAVAFRYVYEAQGYTTTGFATTDYVRDGRPGDEFSIGLVPGGADAVRRVIWDMGD